MVRFLNELMREEGVDYNLIYPKLIQTSPEMYIVQLERESIKLSKLTDSHKELQYFLVAEKFTLEEKIMIFDDSCAAYTLFSYVFGGFYPDSGARI